MLLLELFLVFFRIGLVSFGGGYAMIPVIEMEISERGWLSAQEFYNLIAVSEVTPGSVSINTATFVGYRVSGFTGGLVATLGLVLPSLIIVLIASVLFFRYRDAHLIRSAFSWVKPVVSGLIFVAGAFVAKTCLLNAGAFIAAHYSSLFNYRGIVLFAASDYSIRRFKVPVLPLIGLSCFAGSIVFYHG